MVIEQPNKEYYLAVENIEIYKDSIALVDVCVWYIVRDINSIYKIKEILLNYDINFKKVNEKYKLLNKFFFYK